MKDALIHLWAGSIGKNDYKSQKNDYNDFITWLKGSKWFKKGGWNILLIGLTVFKLIIKGKDSNMKRKVGQRRNSSCNTHAYFDISIENPSIPHNF